MFVVREWIDPTNKEFVIISAFERGENLRSKMDAVSEVMGFQPADYRTNLGTKAQASAFKEIRRQELLRKGLDELQVLKMVQNKEKVYRE